MTKEPNLECWMVICDGLPQADEDMFGPGMINGLEYYQIDEMLPDIQTRMHDILMGMEIPLGATCATFRASKFSHQPGQMWDIHMELLRFNNQEDEQAMTQFEKAIQQDEIKCDICGGAMLAMYGGGWDNDRIVCGGRECGGVIEYPTSTLVEAKQPTLAEAPGDASTLMGCTSPECFYETVSHNINDGKCPCCGYVVEPVDGDGDVGPKSANDDAEAAGQAIVDAMTAPAGIGCTWCGSHAINQHLHGRTVGKMPNLCDVCYWRATAADMVK